MTFRKYLIGFGFLVVSGCTSVQPVVSQTKSQQLNIIDRTTDLELFTTRYVDRGSGYSRVESHNIQYDFNCSGEKYSIIFSSELKSGEVITTQLTNIMKSRKSLTAKKTKEINKDLSSTELVGPVGLRCSFNKVDEKVRVTINSATKNNTRSTYDYSNKKYILSAEDFE